MKNKDRLILLVAFLFLSISAPGCRRDKDARIREIVFTRCGLGVSISRKISLQKVTIASDNPKQSVEIPFVDSRMDALLLNFAWKENRDYTLSISHGGGTLEKKIRAPLSPSAFLLWESPLGKAEGLTKSAGEESKYAQINDWSKVIYEEIAVSSDGMIGVASFDRTIRLWDRYGKTILNFHIPAGVGRAIAFSGDNRYLLAGEAGPDGKLYCFETSSGRLCWSYSTARELGTTKESYYSYQPNVKYLAVRRNTLFVSAQRGWKDTLKTEHGTEFFYPRKSVVYAFDIPSGRKLWQFPAANKDATTNLIDTAVLKLAVDEEGKTIVFSGWGGSADGKIVQQYSENSLYILDAHTGHLLFSWDLTPLGHYGFYTTSVGSSLDLSPNGRFLACTSNDGRLFLYDHQAGLKARKPVLIYEKALSAPIEISGIPLYASGGTVVALNDGSIIAKIGTTYIAPASGQRGRPPQVAHPQENTLYKLDPQGTPCWIWRGGGGMETLRLSAEGRYLIVGMIHDYVNQSRQNAGIYCFDLTGTNRSAEKQVWFYSVEGITLTCDISPDAQYIGAVEGPIDIDPRPEFRQIAGRHRTLLIN
ncbi:MAG: PQQ-binding-like beta-propeller repeat protein [bacterium]